MSVRVRIAPSPTGRLHVGNVYVALHNWLFARQRGGSFLLRLDDTDRERSKPEHAEAIETDLAWLGLGWDGFCRQSDRIALYDDAAAKLRAAGRLYPCYETEEELGLKRKAQAAAHRPPVYDRAALSLTSADRARLEAEGRRPHWRFLLAREDVRWDDLVRGPQHVDEASQSDPVLIREDGSHLYTFSSVVDDIELGITHLIRGADHVTNTGAQIQLFRALGASPPAFAHMPLLVGPDGQPLSKRVGGLGIAELRAAGLEPLALAAYLARIGSGEPMEPVASLQDLVPGHDLARYGRGAPKYDPAELSHLNARHLHAMSFQQALPRLNQLGLAGIDAGLWDAAHGNIATLTELRLWQEVCRGTIDPVIEDAELTRQAAALLPPEPWTAETWGQWTRAVGAATARKGKALFHPLRLALTGRDHGPELRNLLPLIGRARALARLSGHKG
jgi:glutamyl-tRNA synthetase